MPKKYLVTGGAGFIGSAVVRKLIRETPHIVLVLDKLTYAANLLSLQGLETSGRLHFVQADIGDERSVRAALREFEPDIVMHLAAESHVDRSIDGPRAFIETNIGGTFSLLQQSLEYYRDLPEAKRSIFRFHHISTDEVFGSLGQEGHFTEETRYAPNSPYSASKASSDHLVRAWGHTYGFPFLITNCSNNYGPRQFPEKLIPLMILNALEGKALPVYGAGKNVRDWLFVDDHADALLRVIEDGKLGETYAIGGNSEQRNLDVVRAICALMDEMAPDPEIGQRDQLITFVQDRPGHDQRYAIDASKIARDLGWRPKETFETGLKKTVQWYLENKEWWRSIRSGAYCGERLGVKAIA